jgi:hypothetical protein
MKYRDLIVLVVGILLILSLAYTVGVETKFWYLPILLFAFLLIIYYKLWYEK